MHKFKVKITFLDNYWLQVDTDPYTNSFIRKYFTIFKKGAQFAQSYKDQNWDGTIRFYTGTNRLPIGLLQELLNFCNKNTLIVEYTNSRATLKPAIYPVDKNLLSQITLRDYQVDSVNRCLEQGLGIVKIATGGGKTSIITALLKAYANCNLCLIVANQINLVMQLRDRMVQYGFPKEEIGIIYGEEKDWKGKKFVVSTIQSILNYPEVYKYAEILIVDEVKHNAASSYVELVKKCPAIVRLGFDATPFTQEDQAVDWTIKKCMGDIIYEKTTKDLIDLGLLVRPVIGMIKVENEGKIKTMDYRNAYKQLIVHNDMRNNMIRKIAEKEDGRILILIREIEHGRQLQKLIPSAIFLHGEIDSLERYEEIQNFVNSKDKYVLIGSTIFDEGIDFEHGIDAIVIASAGKGFRKTVQRLGRALRQNKKGYVSVYDFYDMRNNYLQKHSESRYTIYKSEQHKVTIV